MKTIHLSRPSHRLQVATAAAMLLASMPFGRAETYLWNVATPGANNWNVNANWTPSTGNPAAADTAVFGSVGTGLDALTVNNVVSVSTTVSVLNFTNTTPANWFVTQIPAGVTLSVTNLNVGFTAATGIATGTEPSDTLVSSVAMLDAGSLSVFGNLTIGNGGANRQNGTMLDLSGLAGFMYANSSGTLQLSAGNRSGASLKLASASNHVTATTVNLNTTSTSVNTTGTLTLGGGTNIFHVGALNAALGRGSCTIQFPATSGPEAGLRIRGSAGTDDSRANVMLANRTTSGTGGTDNGKLLLDGHPVDLKLNTVTVGQAGASGTGAGNIATGQFNFDAGIVDATTINLGVVTSRSNCTANGTINVGYSATLIVGSGGLSLANQIDGGPGTANGTLNGSGGTVICSNSITKANANAGGTGNVTMSGGVLNMVNGVIGTPAVPIDALNLYSAALTLAVAPNTTNVVVTALSAFGSTIHISTLPPILSYPAQFTLMQFASGSSDSTLGNLPPGYAGYLVNNATSVELFVTSGPGPGFQMLTWNGNVNGDWNTSTANWQSGKTYAQNDFVTFDDSASGVTTVNLTGAMTPGNLVVSNSAKSYTFGGAGSLGGAVALNKAGAGTLTLANTGANTFSNGVNILAGTLRASGSADRLPTSTSVTLANAAGAQLDLNSLDQTLLHLYGGGASGGNVSLGSGNLTVSGSGGFAGVISGTGKLIKTNVYDSGLGGGTLVLSNANTYSGGTIIGGHTNTPVLAVANQTGSGTGSGFVQVLTNGTLVIGGTTGPGGSVAAGTITNFGTVRIDRTDDITFTNVIVGSGGFQKYNSNTVAISGANPYTGPTTINAGALRISNAGALGTTDGFTQVPNDATARLELAGGITLLESLVLNSKLGASGGTPSVKNLSDDNTLAGALQFTANGASGWMFEAVAGRLLISGSNTPLDASGTSQNTSRPLWLRGDATGEWSGSINDNTAPNAIIALRKDGVGTWILSGANTYTGTTVVSNGTLLVNGTIAAGGSVTNAGGTLGGTGTIASPVTINDTGTLAPGNSIGGLTINHSLTLNGTTVMEVSHAATDRVVGLTTVTLGGTLKVIVGGALTGGEIFKLFSAAAYSGDFVTYDLPTLSPPLGWDTTKLAVDGSLRVTGGTLTQPALQVSPSGNQFTFSWNNVSFKLQAQTNTLSSGISGNWADYPGGGYSPVTVPINSANPAVFFRLISQ